MPDTRWISVLEGGDWSAAPAVWAEVEVDEDGEPAENLYDVWARGINGSPDLQAEYQAALDWEAEHKS